MNSSLQFQSRFKAEDMYWRWVGAAIGVTVDAAVGLAGGNPVGHTVGGFTVELALVTGVAIGANAEV
jgi:hypothetical protein